MKNQNVNMFRITSIFFAILFLGLLSASITHAETYTFVTKWGSYGSGTGQLSFPHDASLDSSGNIFVADTNNNRIQEFSNNGNYINQYGIGFGYRNGYLSGPNGVAVDKSGNVYVADSGNHRIQKFDSDGNYITQWNSSKIGDGKTFVPYDIAIDSSGNAYVSDNENNRIVKFNINGEYISQWGNYGRSNKQFRYPTSITVDSSGNVYVADTSNTRIQKFDSNGNYLMQLGSRGSGNGQFENPYGVAVDSSGNIYVSDAYNCCIQKFDNKGNFLAKLGGGSSDIQFFGITGIVVDSKGYVYAVDTGNNRIQKLAPTKSPAPVANFISSTTSGNAPLNIAFTDKSTNNPTSWKWDFGDSATSTVQNPTHTYAKAGSYTVTLTATNAGGSNTVTKTAYIKVIALLKPIAAFSASPTAGNSPLSVTFKDSSTNSPTSWKWTFGDGTTSTVQNPIHTYAKAGSYTITLTATNAGGSNTVTKTAYIKVTAPVKPVAAFSATPTSGKASLKVQFADKSTNSPTSWKWTFGDGTTSTTKSPLHTYTKKGKFTVTLTVKNVAGTSTKTITNYITVK